MIVEIKVPALAESVADATLLEWQKQVGDFIKRGDTLIDLETDKVTLEVTAQDDGIIKELLREVGDTVVPGDVLAILETDADITAEKTASTSIEILSEEAPESTDAELAPAPSGPAARKLLNEQGIAADDVQGSGKNGRITKTDVQQHLASSQPTSRAINSTPDQAEPAAVVKEEVVPNTTDQARQERRMPMSRLRQRAAERLLSAQHENAILTTFNEINLGAVKQLRAKLQPKFEKKYGYRLGFMPFFVKAATNALQEFPLINASIEGQEIVYHDYYDIGVAVSSPRGLVVPVMRDADQLSFAGIEGKIRELGEKSRNSTLTMDDLTGGTFTITNGGTFGSMLSTPIINPPQSAILGMHAIQDRPVAEDGQVVIRPVMYVALSYDHRIIDGREAVSFLVSIKKQLEDPALLFLGEI